MFFLIEGVVSPLFGIVHGRFIYSEGGRFLVVKGAM